jgi:NADH:ubiquinone oxidoreductase subunit 6 (subunit J)
MTAATDYPSALFGLLAVMAISGAGGILFCRRRLACVSSWVLCSAALSGFCLLLDLYFLAAAQFTVNLYLAGIILATGRPERGAPAREITSPSHPGRVLWYIAGGAFFVGLAWLLATRNQAIAQEMLGEPTLNSLPMWAARGDHVSTLGQELANRHAVLLALLGVLILASIVSVAYVRRSRHHPGGRDK